MFGEQTFAQLRTGLTSNCYATSVHAAFSLFYTSTYTTEVLFYPHLHLPPSNVSSSGRSHVISLFTNEEQKNAWLAT